MVGYRGRNDGHDTPAIVESMIRIFRCARISKRAVERDEGFWASKERGTDPTAGECLIVEWALALPLTTAFADGYTSAPVKARPLSTNETMEFRLWSSACLHAALSGRARKSPSFASNSMYADSKLELKQIPLRPNSRKLCSSALVRRLFSFLFYFPRNISKFLPSHLLSFELSSFRN